jgi:regulator of sigma E protease
MQPHGQNSSVKNIFYALAGLGGISLIILIHEAGHLLFAKLFDVSAPVFSVGFGPTILAFPFRETVFKIALFPLGGYVEINPEQLAQQAYIPKMLILFGGILFNFIFAYAVLLYYILRNKLFPSSALSSPEAIKQAASTLFTKQENNSSVLGPIGIIHMIGKSITINPQLYWFVLAILSLNIGLLNILPLPFLDGGKMFLITIEAIIGTTISTNIVWFVSSIFLMLFVLFMTQVTMNDIKRLIKR